MKTLLLTFLLPLIVACSVNQKAEKQTISALDEHFLYIGRVSKTNGNDVRFTYPGVTIEARFTGTSVAMLVKPNSGYFMVELDESDPFKIKVSELDSLVVIADSLTDKEHKLRIVYAQEGYEQMPAFRGLQIDANAKILDAQPISDRKIEFIGNSITCGYGVEADSATAHFSYDTENHYYTYAAITARTLKAQELVVSRSGIGIYKNYGGPIEGSAGFTMPDKYELTLFTDAAVTDTMERWNHNLFIPNVVCVNLGTNDTSLDTYDTSLMKTAYTNFVKHLRQIYPNAKIVLLTGSMMSGKALTDCKQVLDHVITDLADTALYRFDFTPQNGSLGYGADYHPSKQQHQLMADELIPFIREITGWE